MSLKKRNDLKASLKNKVQNTQIPEFPELRITEKFQSLFYQHGSEVIEVFLVLIF